MVGRVTRAEHLGTRKHGVGLKGIPSPPCRKASLESKWAHGVVQLRAPYTATATRRACAEKS